MKTKTVCTLVLALAALLVAALCAPAVKRVSAAEAVTDIRVEESEITLQLGGEPVQLTVTVTPASAQSAGVVWLAENPNVVAVDYDNRAHALSEGTTVLHMISNEGKFRDSLTVTVIKTEIELQGVSLDKTEYAGRVGDQFYLIPSVTPEGMEASVVWRSSDTGVAIVNNGTVMLVGEGTCTVSIRDESGRFTASCAVRVTAETPKETSDAGLIIGCSVGGGVVAVAVVAAGLAFGLKRRRKNG